MIIHHTYSTEARLEGLISRLRERGHRITPQRLTVLRLLLDGEHPTAEEVYQQLHAVSPTSSLATVYKTIDMLRRSGEVLEVQVPDRSARYDVVMPLAHPHYICTRCGAVSDLEEVSLKAIEGLRRSAPGSVTDWRLDLFGVCAACSSS